MQSSGLKEELLKYCKSLLLIAKRRNMKTQYILNKIQKNLESFEGEMGWDKFRKMKFVGPKIFAQFAEAILGLKKPDHKEEDETVSLSQNNTTEAESADNLNETLDILERPCTQENVKTKRRKIKQSDKIEKVEYKKLSDFEYIPKYNTTTYCVLSCLSQNDGLNRSQIVIFSQISLDEANHINNLCLWSALKTLMTKNLIFKENRKYYLTKKGNTLCSFLFDHTSENQNEKKGFNTSEKGRIDLQTKSRREDILLLIDAREMKSKNDRTFFERNFPKSRTLNLSVGDFLWIKDKYIINIIIERKKSSDFISSLSDGRFKEQKKRLKSSGIKNIIYLIEGLKSKESFILNAVLNTKLEGFTVIETSDIFETVEYVKMIDNDIRKYHNLDLKDDHYCKITNINFSDFSNKSKKTKN